MDLRPSRRAGLAAAVLTAAVALPAMSSAAPAPTPRVGHVWVIDLENKGFDTTFGADSPARWLNRTLRPQGALLTQYYGVAHNSLPNYLAQISGQAPNPQTQADCQVFTDFVTAGPTVAPDQAVGNGCVYPASVQTLPDQLGARGTDWRGYLQDMELGDGPGVCEHPAIGARDTTQQATATDQYAVRHDPFVYFHSIIDSPVCASSVVGLARLPGDLQRSAARTPRFNLITPDLCHDAHDATCADGGAGGLVAADRFLQRWVPQIQASAAYREDGLIIVTFDESDSPEQDASACCGRTLPPPNTPQPGITGPGGGRVGAVVVGPAVAPGTTSDVPYDHYSLLATLEDLYGVPRLGYAQTAPATFGRDVFSAS